MTIIGDYHRWQLVPTPFCHFRGAMAFYNPELRTLIAGDLVHTFMERMYDLLVGHDLLALELDGTYLEGYRDVIAQFVSRAVETMGPEEVLGVCSELGLPIPPVGAGVEDRVSPETIGPDGIQTQAWWLR